MFWYNSPLCCDAGVRDCVCVVLPQCIEGVIGGADYIQSKVNQWTASIVEQSLTHLVKQGRPFKYIGELSAAHQMKSWHML